jgi:CheY-like chemotaxis protein
VPVGLALALPFLLSVALLMVAHRFRAAAAVAAAGLPLFAWTRASLRRMAAVAGPSAPAPGAPAVRGPQRTILAVDDEPTILALAKDVLELEGYRVLVARNGVEALAAYRDSRGGIDLVLLDLTMPAMGGVECFRRLKQLDPAVRVVISSGFTSEGATVDMLRDGALDCLQKPYEIQALARIVAAALARETTPKAASG